MPATPARKRDPDSPGARRKRQQRARKLEGGMFVPLELEEVDIEWLIKSKLLSGWDQEDGGAVAVAVKKLFILCRLSLVDDKLSPATHGILEPDIEDAGEPHPFQEQCRMNIRTICNTIDRQTGHRHGTHRYIRPLQEAGLLPDDKGDALATDAAALLIAVMSSSSPETAAAAVMQIDSLPSLDGWNIESNTPMPVVTRSFRDMLADEIRLRNKSVGEPVDESVFDFEIFDGGRGAQLAITTPGSDKFTHAWGDRSPGGTRYSGNLGVIKALAAHLPDEKESAASRSATQ